MKTSVAVCLGMAALGAGCRGSAPTASQPIRLVDLYRPEPGTASKEAPAQAAPGTEFRFASAVPPPKPPTRPAVSSGGTPGDRPAPRGPPWSAGPGVTDLQVKDGHLMGRAVAANAIVYLRGRAGRSLRPPRGPGAHARVGRRERVGAVPQHLRGGPEARVRECPDHPWPLNTPIVAGPEMRTYILHTTASIPMASRISSFARPTPWWTFEIESIRMVSRRENLSSIREVLSWEGLGEVYRETLVARAPDALRFDVELLRHPRLQLAAGMLEPGPVTFKVAVLDGKHD